MMAALLRFLGALPLVLVSPILAAISALLLFASDLVWNLFGRKRPPQNVRPDNLAATVVIPNWNGRDLLAKYLPSVVTALSSSPRSEILVVDNASSDDSVQFLRSQFPEVHVLTLDRNYGFGGGSNRGFAAATNHIVVLLNSDMRVAPDFLQPLLDGFSTSDVFAVSCQIFFSDPNKLRQETGMPECWWHRGMLRARHRADASVESLWPCFYAGGGSSAFDRRKFLELGGFDDLLHPFYMEDSDLGLMAWKRGWRILYQPGSRVWHEHRGTIGKTFSRGYIDGIIGKNAILYAWKNAHTPCRLLAHFTWMMIGGIYSWVAGVSPLRMNFPALGRAFLQLPQALRSRWRARALAVHDDNEAFRRSRPIFYHDRFSLFASRPERPRVLFVCPYPVWPPVHGGAISIYGTVTHLARFAEVHMVVLCETPAQLAEQERLREVATSVTPLLRRTGVPPRIGTLQPHAVREFRDEEVQYVIEREILRHSIDIVQLEYTNIGQYLAMGCLNLAWILFEHDIYFQSVRSRISALRGSECAKAFFEYLRALRFELRLLRRVDRVQVCTPDNRDFLLSFQPRLRDRIDCDVRAGMDLSRFKFQPYGRQPCTMLFLGSFRHKPNLEALEWFLDGVMPRVLERYRDARLRVLGSDPPPRGTLPDFNGAVSFDGFVPDLTTPLAESAVFVCPILSGSGVRMKLQESFAAGIPSVSTTLGAEGLGAEDGLYCRLADDHDRFAQAVIDVFEHPEEAAQMARRARLFIEESRGLVPMTQRLMATYRRTLLEKRGA
jgi:GT2 family glycosyltransferase/glycosyltransferase involved in cell wall biosynthesis